MVDERPRVGGPLVTVAVMCFNHREYVEQCLESVAAQDYDHLDLIVVDDGSTDDSRDVIESWIARDSSAWRLVLDDSNKGLCPRLNDVLAMADGEFLVAIAADDWMVPDRVSRQIGDFLGADRSVVVSYCDTAVVDANGLETGADYVRPQLASLGLGVAPEGDVFGALLKGNFIPAVGAMSRVTALREVGGYDPDAGFEDYDLWLRLARVGTFRFCPHVLCAYRVVASSMSRTTLPSRKAAIRVRALRKHLTGPDHRVAVLVELMRWGSGWLRSRTRETLIGPARTLRRYEP